MNNRVYLILKIIRWSQKHKRTFHRLTVEEIKEAVKCKL